MRAVLGIDAAWTSTAPSGVALCIEETAGWRCVAVAPSYAAFVGLADGTAVDWTRKHVAGNPDPRALLAAVHAMTRGANVEAVSIDIPLSHAPITGRREADDAVSRAYGGRKCGTHSPSPDRPGVISTALRDGFQALGFHLATTLPLERPAFFEVYPHPALLSLVSAKERVTYKVTKARSYWPDCDPEGRRSRIVERWREILGALRRHIHLDLELPDQFPSLSAMKRYEDAIDALICAWVAIRFLEGRAVAFGDADAAVWVPR
jgi:predicted RNase H-like nuclease